MPTARVRLEAVAADGLATAGLVGAILDPADPDQRLGALRAALDGVPAAGWDGTGGVTVQLDQTTYLPVRLRPGAARAASLRDAAAAIVRRAAGAQPLTLAVPPGAAGDDDALTAILEGVILGTYAFVPLDAPRARAEPEATTVGVAGAEPARLQALGTRAQAFAGAAALARDLVNEPGGSLTPRRFVDVAEQHAGAGLDVRVLAGDELSAAGLAGLLAVSRGSQQPPQLLELAYRPPGATGHVALVGKGITFDTGGLQLKSGADMRRMKADMAGAAAVLGAVVHLPCLAPAVQVTATIPLSDNMPGPDATRPGDFIRYPDGTTVEVGSTDAEGRLVLADALLRAAAARPDLLIDLATLTGACEAALGPEVAGLFSNDDDLAALLTHAADRCGEPLWRLPLVDAYVRLISSDLVDLVNIGPKEGGAITAALFLRHFVPDGQPWAHVDMSSPAVTDRAHGALTKGATGYGARLLLQAITEIERTWARRG